MTAVHDALVALTERRSHADARAMLDELTEREKLTMEAVTYLRGRSLQGTYVLVDEAQNLEPTTLKTILTRVGEGTKVVFTGDTSQIDAPYLSEHNNAVSRADRRLRGRALLRPHPPRALRALRGGQPRRPAPVAVAMGRRGRRGDPEPVTARTRRAVHLFLLVFAVTGVAHLEVFPFSGFRLFSEVRGRRAAQLAAPRRRRRRRGDRRSGSASCPLAFRNTTSLLLELPRARSGTSGTRSATPGPTPLRDAGADVARVRVYAVVRQRAPRRRRRRRGRWPTSAAGDG